jgi:endonuclease/exonuclease/phosphatase family metal-dependent hydrolase
VVAGACCAGAFIAPATAAPGASGLLKPTNVVVTAAAHTSLTVSFKSAGTKFRLYLGHHKPDVAEAHLSSNDLHSPWTHKKTITMSGLHYSGTPYYYRVLAKRGSSHAVSLLLGPVGLRPKAPTGLATANPHGALSLSWNGVAGTGYRVERASNASFSAGRKNYGLLGPGVQFTPADLTPGTTYFFRVRAINAGTASAASNVVSGSTSSTGIAITAMTFNLHEADIPAPAGESWPQRRPKVVELIKDEHPNVIAIQEAAAWVAQVKGPRQVDDLVDALGGTYKLARTEIPPSEPHYQRTADYILYDPNVVDTVGQGDHWDLGHASDNNHWAAYQQFKVLSTGTKFVFASLHLYVKNNNPATDDQIRQDQTASLLSQGSAYAASLGEPIFYAGDTNSAVEDKHKFDGPRVAFQAEHVADAFSVAPTRVNKKYDTANHWERKPPAHHDYIDGVFVPPGVAATKWHVVLHLSHGKFVGPIPSDHNPLVVTVVLPT